MSPKAAANFMRFVAIVSLLSALIFALGAIGDPTGILSQFLAIIIPGSDGVGGIATPEAKVGLAIAGGLFAGFMVMLLLVTAPAIEQSNAAIKRASIYALLAWFIVDSSASIAGGVPLNALSNSILLILYLLPLVWVKAP
ncbi:hypothetical protein [Parasphingorhabdus cellanae]|uniref:Excinuclease ABC subunit A n=1 Tax=Parasphingorhabdus cellanae TaxID=2806553 RepID=A0ABX7T2Q5_9SPHN|nr:hypothetical protein [Parasphingorhabdus cellanae]QTD54555.1 hypothetical protein J4G78_09665 [Parasphingorhabdus cellanae]